MTDTLDRQWCCFTCNTTFRLGLMKLGRTSAHPLRCPNCDSGDTHPADGSAKELTEYHGEIGTRN